MRDTSKCKIYSAVQGCLAECYGKLDPLVHATAFLESLRGDPHWKASEVAEVESLVLRAVRVIVRQPRSDCCHGS